MKPLILLDVDGLIADYTSAAFEALRPHGCPLTHDDCTQYNMHHVLEDAGLSHLVDVFKRLPYKPGFCRSIKPYPGATMFLRKLRTVGRVVALSACSPGPWWRAERAEWLEDYGFKADEIDLVDDAKKFSKPGDVLIEDKLETWLQAKQPVRILLERPWNKTAYCGPTTQKGDLYVCKTLVDVYQKVEYLFGVHGR